MSRLVFLDLETTGLDPLRHSVWEIAWAVEDEPISSALVAHQIVTADPEALNMNGYYDRQQPSISPRAAIQAELMMRRDLRGATVVGSNPAFDTAFLRNRWGDAPWHYRLFDIAAYAAGVLRHPAPQGLSSIADQMRDRGFTIPIPDHSARGDVDTLRACFRALQSVAAQTSDTP